MSEWKVQIRDSFACDNVEILIWSDLDDGRIAVVEPVEIPVKIRTIGEMEPVKEPSIRIGRDVARSLLPSLVEALDKKGIKPPTQSYSEGQLDAMKLHLADMRKLVFVGSGLSPTQDNERKSHE